MGRYDSTLQMFVESPADLNADVLAAWRWSVENRFQPINRAVLDDTYPTTTTISDVLEMVKG